MSAERFDPRLLIAWVAEARPGATLRFVARRLQIRPSVLCRPLTMNQADRYAVAIGAHPLEVWRQWFASPELDREDHSICSDCGEPVQSDVHELCTEWSVEQSLSLLSGCFDGESACKRDSVVPRHR